jgi:hypothetical protein
MRPLLLALVVLLAVPAAAAPAGPQPRPLDGRALLRHSGLRLLVAANPPFVLDVDAGRVRAVRGLGHLDGGVLWVVAVGGRSGVVVAESFGETTFGVRGPAAPARALGVAAGVWPAEDGRSVWLQRRIGSRCTLRRAGLDGRLLRRPRAFPCATRSSPAGPFGIVVSRTRLVDPETGRTLFRSRQGILAVTPRHVVTVGEDGELALVERSSGSSRSYAWESLVGPPGEAVVDPSGRYVALGAGNPAWQLGARQVQDAWLLDTTTGELAHVPGFPAWASLKSTSMAWTGDGRLVVLAETEARQLVAVWRPGETQLAVKAVRLPERDSGSDTFAPVA